MPICFDSYGLLRAVRNKLANYIVNVPVHLDDFCPGSALSVVRSTTAVDDDL